MTPGPRGDGERTRRTVPSLTRMKERGQRIVCLTAYDALTAGLLDQAGVDVILVGDSGGQVMAGRPNTLGTTLEEMLHFTRWAARGAEYALLVADMPFLTYQVNPDEAVRNAGRLMAEGGAEAVKLEGGRPMAGTVRRLVQTGIPVMGHLGLTPQSVNVFGGYRLQAADEETADALLQDALALQEAGCFALVLEKVPAGVAARVTEALGIPTIGIGAGPDCDGQVLVTQDMLGIFEDFRPRFVRRYAGLADTIRDAVRAYAEDVREGTFPSEEESYGPGSAD
ncbi:MAG: 3-methyl-2-oxobutanoate hydroxymethyltransferase [bacterium]